MYIAYGALWLLFVSNLLGIAFGIYGYISAKQWERFAKNYSNDDNDLSFDSYVSIIKHEKKRFGFRRMYSLTLDKSKNPKSRLLIDFLWRGKKLFKIQL